MWVHFDTEQFAKNHLNVNGWSLVGKTGRWVSKDGTCRATIHPVPGSEKVAVCYVEVE